MLSIENNFTNDNISIETEDFKSMIYNQPVDGNFTLYFVKTLRLRNDHWCLVGRTESKAEKQRQHLLFNKKILTICNGSNFSYRPR